MTLDTFAIIQIGIPGGPELLIVLLIAVLLFGASRIPKLARASGQALGEFKKGREELESELEEVKGTVDTDTQSTDPASDRPDNPR